MKRSYVGTGILYLCTVLLPPSCALRSEQNSRNPSLPILDAEPRPVVFSGEMAKTKRSTKPHIYWRSGIPGKGATARVLIYTKVCLPDGRITKQNIAHNLGKVTLAEAERMRDELM